MLCLWQLYAAVIQNDRIFEGVPLDSLFDFICEDLAEHYTAKEARTALGLPGGLSAEEHSIPAMLLCQYQNHWQHHYCLLHYQT
jgi:hypothetical protein